MPLRPYVEHYWLIDWELQEPYVTRVVPHPSVNMVFERYGGRAAFGEVAGIGLDLFTLELSGTGRVCGVQFRPGGFRPFAPAWPVSHWTGRRVPFTEAFPPDGGAGGAGSAGDIRGAGDAEAILGPDAEEDRVAALDTLLLSLSPRPDPDVDLALALTDRVRTDRAIRRVANLAEDAGLSVRSLQRLFAGYVGVSPKWVILRYRLHEALERAGRDTDIDWAGLAAELGYSDQAHLARDFTATLGVPPAVYVQA